MKTPISLLEDGRDWLDGQGKMAWIMFMVAGFIIGGPLGLIILFYMIGTNRMGKCSSHRKWQRRGPSSTGNTAFDAYREETLKRLEDEQSAFQTFLGNLRASKDRAEFDQFMTSRDTTADVPTQSPA